MPERESQILRSSQIPAVSRGGGIMTIPLLTRKTGARTFINGITIIPAGVSVPLHKHNCDETVLVLEGQAFAEISGTDYPVAQGDMTVIPEGVHHCFKNTSSNSDLKILWTYASIDADRTIIATGETRRIDDEHSAPAN